MQNNDATGARAAALRKHLQEVEEGWYDLSVRSCAQCYNNSVILSAEAVLEV